MNSKKFHSAFEGLRTGELLLPLLWLASLRAQKSACVHWEGTHSNNHCQLPQVNKWMSQSMNASSQILVETGLWGFHVLRPQGGVMPAYAGKNSTASRLLILLEEKPGGSRPRLRNKSKNYKSEQTRNLVEEVPEAEEPCSLPSVYNERGPRRDLLLLLHPKGNGLLTELLGPSLSFPAF